MLNQRQVEVIRENLSPAEVMAIRQQERRAGRLVNVSRLNPNLVEIEIIHQEHVIDVTPQSKLLQGGQSHRYALT